MAVLHIVPLPEGARAVKGPAFAMILEIDKEQESHVTAAELEQLTGFSRDAGAAAFMVTDRSMVTLSPGAVQVEPGPCPSYMEGLGTVHLCDLRFGHDGLHEETKPGDKVYPAQRATWGERERWDQSAAGGFTGVTARDQVIDLAELIKPGGGHRHMWAEPCTDDCYGDVTANTVRLSVEPILGVCQVKGCERPTVDSDYCEVHKDPQL